MAWPIAPAGCSTRPGSRHAAFTDVHIEPTDGSLATAGAWARETRPDGYLAIGGGSVIDTAKAMNLLATNDGELTEYLNPPIGAGRAPTRPLSPIIAVPTTAGHGRREHAGVHRRDPRPASQDRDQPPGPAARASRSSIRC